MAFGTTSALAFAFPLAECINLHVIGVKLLGGLLFVGTAIAVVDACAVPQLLSFQVLLNEFLRGGEGGEIANLLMQMLF